MNRRCTCFVAAALMLVVARVSPAARGIDATDLLKIRSIDSIDVSRDGSRAVIVVRSIEEQDINGALRAVNQSHLFLLDLFRETAPPRQLTFGARHDHSPVLSPDGRWIAFVRGGSGPDEPDHNEGQVWIMPTDGGEARPAAATPFPSSSPQWSPDGRSLLVTSPVAAEQLPGEPTWSAERVKRTWRDTLEGGDPDGSMMEIRAWLDGNAGSGDPLVYSRLEFQDDLALREPIRFQQLFLLDSMDQRAEPQALTAGFMDHREAVFSADGAHVLFVSDRRTDRHPDRELETCIWRIAREGGAPPERYLELDGWSLRAPQPSRDGSVLAFLAEPADEPAYRLQQLGTAPVHAEVVGEPVWLTDSGNLDRSVHSFRWMAVNSSIIFSTASSGAFPLMTTGFSVLEPSSLVDRQNDLPVGVHAFGVGGGAIVYSLTGIENPCTLRVRDARGDRLVWDLNEWVRDRDLVKPVEVWIARPDGTRVQYWLMPPLKRAPSAKAPLVVEIHGGPAAMWGPGEFTMWHEFQHLCARGYAVAYCNPRGSDGSGYSFRRANFQNWSEGPASDVMAMVEEIATRDWIDADRMFITGGSYGGYLTAWIISQYPIFKAAVAQRGVYDLATFFGEGNAWRLVEWCFGGKPWDPRVRTILQRESPFTHVNRIHTPLLIMHASNDLRTGVSQSEMMYRALKVLERPVEYVRYPNAGHDLSRSGDPNQRIDRINRIVEFFDRFRFDGPGDSGGTGRRTAD